MSIDFHIIRIENGHSCTYDSGEKVEVHWGKGDRIYTIYKTYISPDGSRRRERLTYLRMGEVQFPLEKSLEEITARYIQEICMQDVAKREQHRLKRINFIFEES